MSSVASNSFKVLDIETELKSLSFNEVPEDNAEKLTGISYQLDTLKGFKPVENRRKHRPAKVELHEFTEATTEVKLTNLVNNVSHYLELANEAINCLCSKALKNIEVRQDKIDPGTLSLNILGPIYKNDFYVRLDDKKYAFVKENVVRSGKLELDGVVYNLNLQDAIRMWDVMCGPNDRPKLFRENNMLSLGEKLQKIIQEKVHQDLLKEGTLQPTDPYTPTVWLFLAFRYNYSDQRDRSGKVPARFINMCWNSDGTPPKSLVKVSEYCDQVFQPRRQRQFNNKPSSEDQQKFNSSRKLKVHKYEHLLPKTKPS